MWRDKKVRRKLFEEDEESDNGDYHASNAPMDFLLDSIERCAEVQRTTAEPQLRCECTEGLSLRSSNMASTSFLRSTHPFSHLMYYSGAPEVSDATARNSDDILGQRNEDDVEMVNDDQIRVTTEEYFVSSVQSKLTRGCAPTKFKECEFSHRASSRRCLQDMPQPSLHAKQVANRVIRYARCTRNIYEKDMCCLDCGHYPFSPITLKCGHTRCVKCIRRETKCPCGSDSPQPLCVNIVIRNLIENTTSVGPASRLVPTAYCISPDEDPLQSNASRDKKMSAQKPGPGPIRTRRKSRARNPQSFYACYHRVPMSPLARLNHAVELLKIGRHMEAAPHLALAAASQQPAVRLARSLLANVIMVISKNRDPRALTSKLTPLIRHISSTTWIKKTDLECTLCCETFTNPVTTPCGHMFCRTCIERTLDYRKRCPLCLKTLSDFKLTEIGDTVLVQAALAAINAIKEPAPSDPDLIPIFMCTVAYPSVPCPLFIFDPRYWLMLRRILESGSRKFGMVTCDKGRNYADYGTILEVRDCVHLEDGRSILSTIGLSRFKVVEREVRDGCDVARIVPIKDVVPVDESEIWGLKLLAAQVKLKALLWLHRLNKKVLADIWAAFGRFPSSVEDSPEEWWKCSDGPAWLWWFVGVLPLRSEIKVLILSTDCLSKRLLAVLRTLEAVKGITLTTAT